MQHHTTDHKLNSMDKKREIITHSAELTLNGENFEVEFTADKFMNSDDDDNDPRYANVTHFWDIEDIKWDRSLFTDEQNAHIKNSEENILKAMRFLYCRD